ncbi:MAG TPA: HD domain-containing phosphohydrolase [Chloroflexia bacterium]|nr:HD domain-containing phosphohydrolase [Chloroflexia bacterium]
MPGEPLILTQIRLAELISALSVATDLGMGQPLEFALCTNVLAVRLGEALKLNEEELREVYYLALLRHIGCNAETYKMAAVIGDELALRREVASIDTRNLPQVMGLVQRLVRQANTNSNPLQLAMTLVRDIATFPVLMRGEFAGFCEVAQRLAERLGFGEGIVHALGQAYERWDGKGMPAGLRGEQIARSVHLVSLAQDVITFFRLGGPEAAVNMVRERTGKAYHPQIAEQFCLHSGALLAGLEEEPSWELVLSLEPGKRLFLSESQFEEACLAIADFADIKSPYTVNHSRTVAELVEQAACRYGLPQSDAVILRRAGWLHDVGQVGISAGIWGKTGVLSGSDWEKVRLHTYYTERILARPAPLARIGRLASHHHERLDGSGYHRNLSSGLPPAVMLLAVADMYRALLEDRPHRAAFSPEAAALELSKEVKRGRLDADAVRAVLEVAGHSPEVSGTHGNGLTGRELEVIRLIARGHTMKQMAALLSISEKTVDNHIQRIYTKIGVSTRAGATLYAMEHNLLK